MYVRVLNFVCRADAEQSEIQRVYRLLADQAGSVDGFIGSSLLMREGACNGMALIYWKDSESASRAGPELLKLLAEHAHHLLDHAPDVEGFYVIENGIIPTD